jgi:hypothetical protein
VWQRLATTHVDEHINCPLANGIHIVEANGGQRWPHQLAGEEIIGSHESNVLRNAYISLSQCFQQIERTLIIEGVNPCRMICTGERGLHQEACSAQCGGKWEHVQPGISSSCESRAHPIQSLLEYFFEQWVARVNDAKVAMAALQQVLRGDVAYWPSGKDDGCDMLYRSDRDQHDVFDAHLASERNLIGRIRELTQNETRGAAGKHPPQRFTPSQRRSIRAGIENRSILMSNYLLLKREIQTVGEKTGGCVDDAANLIALPPAQRTRRGMGVISQLLRRLQNFLTSLFAHMPVLSSIEDIRNGCLRDACRYIAEDALDLIQVDYDPLPPVPNMEVALDPASAPVFEEAGDNIVYHDTVSYGDVDDAFSSADRVITQTFRQHRYINVPMETRGGIAV